MRDVRKTDAYFKDYISYEQGRIQKKTEKLMQCDNEEKAGRIRNSLFLYQMNILIASFSAGREKAGLKTLLQLCCDTAQKLAVLGYEDALRIASFSTMLESPEEICAVAKRFPMVFECDKLLRGFVSFAETGTAAWTGAYKFPEVYAGMDSVLDTKSKEEQEKALLKYLDGWYERNRESAWYGTADSTNDVYYGYWSFESAAVATALKLDLAVLAQNQYFPKL